MQVTVGGPSPPPAPSYFYFAYCPQVAAGVPVDQLITFMMRCVNHVSSLGWEPLLPAQIMSSGGAVIGSPKVLNILIWLRCPAESPLVRQPPGPPPEYAQPLPPPEEFVPAVLSEGRRPEMVH